MQEIVRWQSRQAGAAPEPASSTQHAGRGAGKGTDLPMGKPSGCLAEKVGTLALGPAIWISNVTSTEGGAGNTASATLTVAVPAVTTQPATEVGRGSATLNGSVNPNGSATSAWFEWGTDPALTAFTSTSLQAVGSGLAAVAVTAALPEPGLPALRPATTYYFRVVASNSAGTTKGSILSFMTRVVTQILVTENFLSDGEDAAGQRPAAFICVL